jgi:hypothetical protein
VPEALGEGEEGATTVHSGAIIMTMMTRDQFGFKCFNAPSLPFSTQLGNNIIVEAFTLTLFLLPTTTSTTYCHRSYFVTSMEYRSFEILCLRSYILYGWFLNPAVVAGKPGWQLQEGGFQKLLKPLFPAEPNCWSSNAPKQ